MLAVEHTGIGSDDVAYSTLRACEAVLSPDGYVRNELLRLKLLAVTYNNLGAYFHNRGKLHGALHYLTAALRLETMLGASESPACTHLNLCAILSRLGRHEEAIDHVQCSLELLTREIGSAQPAPELSGLNFFSFLFFIIIIIFFFFLKQLIFLPSSSRIVYRKLLQ
jgi:tetratricopeptide (TPR) repeat protein